MVVAGTLPFLLRVTSLTSSSSPDANDIEGYLTKVAEAYNFPALAAGYANETFHDAVVGVRKIGTDVNATTSDIWHIGSNTKAMTATTIGLLIQDGLLQWTSTLGDLLYETIINIRDVYSNVTIEQLSSHTSGISDEAMRADVQMLLDSYQLSAADGRINFANGTLSSSSVATQGTYTYSNMNYVLLGFVIDT
jgi:D-alanyl-D-alanine carboxypeptidase